MTDKFKQMPFNKKVEHIWQYYRVPIFLIVFFTVLVGWLINDIFINPAPRTYTGVAFYDNYVNNEITSGLRDSFTEKYVPEGENLQVKFSSYYDVESDPTVAVDMAQKFEMLLYAKEIDIIVTGKNPKTEYDYFTQFAKDGLLAPLDVIYTKEELEQFEKDGILAYCKDGNGVDRPFGLSMKNVTSVLKDYEGFKQETKYAGISNVTERVDNAKQVLKGLVE